MSSSDGIDHGTYGGYMQCRKMYEKVCDECRAAATEHMRNYRRTHPEKVKRGNGQVRIAEKAMRILRDRHRAEYSTIVEELKKRKIHQMKAMIFDLDGVLVDARTISHHFEGKLEEDKDYDAYHRESVDVPPVKIMVDILNEAQRDGYAILIMTARRRQYLQYTGTFIVKNNVHCDMLFMRDDDDIRPDWEVKLDMYEKAKRMGFVIERAYDDNPEVYQMWMNLGIEARLVSGWGFKYE